MQTIFNLLPNLNIDDLVRAFLVKTNDMHLVIYLSSLIRCIVALHDLVKNKIQFKDLDEFGEKTADAGAAEASAKEPSEVAAEKKGEDKEEKDKGA